MAITRAGRPVIAIAYASMCTIWGSTWIMIKLGLRDAPPLTAVAVRFIIAALVTICILAARKTPVPRTKAFFGLCAFLSVFHLTVPYALVYWGEQHISSGLTAVLYSTMPINVALLARVLIGDPLTPRKIAGIFVGFAGVWVIFSDNLSFGGGSAVQGMIACLVSAFFASLSTVVVKKYASRYDPFATLAIPFAGAGLLLTVLAASVERSNPFTFSALTWFTVFYLAALGSVSAFALYFWIIKRIDVTVLSYQTFIIPVLALLIGWIFLRETVTIRVAAGASLIIAGIVLATLRRRAPAIPSIRDER
ncbi:MAG: DMT family transporter [Candidatus Latescibacterota bacterium]|jgi:putative membrane protein PagO